MHKFIAAVLLYAAIAGGAAEAQVSSGPQPDPYADPIEQCIRANAAKVEASEADITEAVDLLVGRVCAVPLAEKNAQRVRQTQVRTAEAFQRMCDQQTAAKSDPKQDSAKAVPQTPDFCMLAHNTAGILSNPAPPFDAWTATALPSSSYPAAAVQLAAQILLELRASHRHRGN